MAKTRRKLRDSTRQPENPGYQSFEPMPQAVRVTTPIKPKTETQRKYIDYIKGEAPMIFATGPAGCGKTYLCGALAADAMDAKRIDKIIITRPAVEAGENLGFLPGELEDKFEPYLRPFRDVLDERLGKSRVDYMLKAGQIEAAPLAYMRGRTFKNAWVILDEAQNTTPMQMRMFLTRMGENCKMIVNGDLEQKDIIGTSGLEDAINRVGFIPSIRIVNFRSEDIVRCGLVQEIVEAYASEAKTGADITELNTRRRRT